MEAIFDMQTQTFETSKGTILVVDLPDSLKNRKIVITKAGCPDIELIALGGTHPEYIGLLPPGDWQPLGLLPEISEEQAKEVVDFQITEGYLYEGPTYHEIYRDYSESEKMWELKCDQFNTASGSLQSLIETKINLVNAWGEKPKFTITEYGVSPVAYEYFEDDLKEWKTAEFQVWKNPFLMFKKK